MASLSEPQWLAGVMLSKTMVDRADISIILY
jgi:hypothetical protein